MVNYTVQCITTAANTNTSEQSRDEKIMMDVECVNNMVISTCDKRVYSSVYTNSRFFFDRFSAEWGEV